MEKKTLVCKDCNKETHIKCWRCVEPICPDCLTSYGLRHYCKDCYKIEFKKYKSTITGDICIVTKNKWSALFVDMIRLNPDSKNSLFSEEPKVIKKKDFDKMVSDNKYKIIEDDN